MPSSSKAQAHFMAAVAHNPKFAKAVGVAQSVGKDFNTADKGRTFKEGGSMESDKARELRHSRTLAKLSKEELAEANAMKKGGMAMATKGVNPFAKFEQSGKDKETGKMGKEGSKKEEAFDKKEMKFAKGGFMAKADGIAQKGKTQAKCYAEGGGVREGENTNIDSATLARALAWVAKQAAKDTSEDTTPVAKTQPIRTTSRTSAGADRTMPEDKAMPQGGAYRGMRSGAGGVKESEQGSWDSESTPQGGAYRGMRSGAGAKSDPTNYSNEGRSRTMSPEDMDAYSSAKAKKRAWRPEDDALEGVYPEELLLGGPLLRGAKTALGAAKAGSRALSTVGPEELEFLGRTAARRIAPEAEQLSTSAAKRLANNPTKRLADTSPRQISSSEAEQPLREEIMKRSNWTAGPEGELGLKKGGKVQKYAAGGSVKGWGLARGSKAAKIV